MSGVFSVLHVCTGNICRSPMSERILDGLTGDEVFNHGAGTGNWHEGEDMQTNSRLELADRGFEAEGHRARRIERAHVEASDLILVATGGHLEYISDRFPEARDRTFLVRQFGRIAADVAAELPDDEAASRGRALVEKATKLRGEYRAPDLSDPWGMDRGVYAEIADQLVEALEPVAEALEER